MICKSIVERMIEKIMLDEEHGEIEGGKDVKNDDLKLNGSGVRDVTAEKAIRKADHQPYEVTEMLDMLRKIAELWGYEIDGRVAFRNKKTGIVYK